MRKKTKSSVLKKKHENYVTLQLILIDSKNVKLISSMKLLLFFTKFVFEILCNCVIVSANSNVLTNAKHNTVNVTVSDMNCPGSHLSILITFTRENVLG